MGKFWCGTISVMLVVVMLINMLPLNALAIDNNSTIEMGEEPIMQEMIPVVGSTDIEQIYEAQPAYVVEEDVSKRSEFYKEFILSNGLRLATIYPDSVHYEENGQWKEIDNTLTAQIVDGQNVYTNVSGLWDVRFPQRLTGSNSITISKDGYTISFGMAGEMRSDGDLVVVSMGNELTTNTSSILPSAGSSIDSIAQVQRIDTATAKAEAEYAEIIPDKLHSRVLYPTVYTNTNIVYDLQSNQVKESIILQSFDSDLMGYRYTLDTGGLIPVLNDDQSINLCDPNTDDIVMTMPAPFMLDAHGEYCEDITVSLVQTGRTYIISYDLPVGWLGAEDRAWPIILDPVISANNATNNIQDITVAENGTESNTAARVKCGYHPTLGICRFYLRFKTLPALTSSMVIVKANITLTKNTSSSLSAPIEVHKVDTPWEASQTNWSNKPNYQSNIEDVTTVEDAGEYTWDITDIAFGWYADTQNTLANNTGMLFKAASDVETAQVNNWQQLCSSDHTLTRPVLTITYIDTNGLESYWDTTSSSAGRAGTGYVQPYSGNLTWVHTDIGFEGNLMPVSISHIYNTSDAIAEMNLYGMGIGWRTNYNQRIIDPEDGTFVWEDGDGTPHTFITDISSGTIHDTDDLHLSLSRSTNNGYVITDKYGNKSEFDSTGRLTALVNNQQKTSNIAIEYVDTSTHMISQILDGAGRKYSFSYSNGLLASIIYYGNGSTAISNINFNYTGSKLTTITYADNKSSIFNYTSTELLSSATDIDGYKISFSYNTLDTGKPIRVISIAESDDGQIGGTKSLNYTFNRTVLTDHNENSQTYFFNCCGNTISIQDSEGRATFNQYENENPNEGVKNRLIKASQQQNTVTNRITDHSFEKGTLWTPMFSTADSRSDVCEILTDDSENKYSYLGFKSMRITCNNFIGSNGAYSASYITYPGKTYTFSAYVYDISAGIQLAITDGTNAVFSSIHEQSGWERLEVTYTNNTTENSMITLQIRCLGTGSAIVDCVQLENTAAASRYNLLESADANTAAPWVAVDGSTGYADICHTSPAPTLSASQLELQGALDRETYIFQTVNISGKTGDSFVFGGWMSKSSLPGDSAKRAISITFNNTDGTKTYAAVSPNPHLLTYGGWQYIASSVTAEKDYNSIIFKIEFNYDPNYINIDGLQLFLDERFEEYEYTNGNLTKVVDVLGQTTTYSYNSKNELITTVLPAKIKVENTYDAYHNLSTSSKYYPNEETSFEDTTYTYDEYGNVTQTTITSDAATKTTSSTYENNGNTLKSTTDAAGGTTQYTYDADTGLLEAVQPPLLSCIYYRYDPLTFQLAETFTYVNGSKKSILYSYEDDMLETIQTPSTAYTLAHDLFALRSSVVAGENTLATYYYTNYTDRYLSRLDYGNSDRVNYTYDSLGRVIQELHYKVGGSTYRVINYSYDANGTLATVKDSKTGITTKQYYDNIGRNIGFWNSTTNNSHSVQYVYDQHGRIEQISESVNYSGVTQAERKIASYEYDDHRNQLLSISFNTGTMESYEYDEANRVIQKSAKYNGTNVLTEEITYNSNNDRIAVLDIDNWGTYQYTYDANGNITEVVNGNKTTYYTYDSQNQLIREDNPHQGKTWIWTYDAAGNILSKTEYAYTRSEHPTQGYTSIAYGYGNSSWGDLLTSYNGNAISYDAIGNPLNDGTWTYTWEQGRQLARMSSGSNIWNFTYDANGMRTGRSNLNNTSYTYVYNGSQLSWMYSSSGNMSFTYGADGSPLTITYNGATYYYVTNIQGDVVAILNNAGTAVVNYTYDAWGKPLTTTGSMANTLGMVNPLRYRGYVYDRETGLYYLQSRYYNPEWGRFINADSQLATGDFTGLNLFAYCGNNPVNRTDPTGDAWWHWAVAAAVVAAAAVAVVVTAGGAAAAITAVTLVANGVAASTTAATVAAGVFIGSATAFAGSAYIAAISSNSAEEFASYGGSALVNTTIGGFLGGTSAYSTARTSNQSTQYAGESACFIAGTLIRTDNGSVPIEQIAVGDLVWAWDEDTGQIELKPVVETYINEADELIHIFINGEEIITTSEHPFYSPVKGWTEAARLCVGDILVLVNGDYAVVEKVLHENLDIPIPVFNFQVADFHTYHVGSIGILVHNTCGQYSPPKGGGGITDTIQVGDTTVTFGHGGRHLVGTNLTTSQVNPVIANDVVARNLPVGTFSPSGQVSVGGQIIIYTAKVLSNVLINIGTYHIK